MCHPLHTGGYTAPLRAGSVARVEGVFRRLEDHTSDVELFSVEDTASGETFLLPSWPMDVNLGQPVALGAFVSFVSTVSRRTRRLAAARMHPRSMEKEQSKVLDYGTQRPAPDWFSSLH